jgi:hypothetical protein
VQSTQSTADLESQLIDDIGSFTHDPLGHARYAYPWGEPGQLADESLRDWQIDTLRDIGDHLKNPETRYTPLLYAVSSGHGIGKSATIAMIVNWGMDTCVDCRVVITANTEGQLRTKTAPEVLKWRRMSITSHWFTQTATSIYSSQADHDKGWRCDFIPWSDTNPEAFAGLHNKGRRIIVVMDEGSAIDDAIWEVVEGALTDEQTEIIWLVFGNPTRNIGRFRECFRKFSRLWKTRKIDSRDVKGTNKELIAEWEKTYGTDSDFFKVRVRGEFPNMSAYQFISQSDLDTAKGKHLKVTQYNFAPKIISVDPAWTGDDNLVIAMRQGLYFQILAKIPKNDNDILIGNMVARHEDEHQADAVIIDGGFGTGIYSAGKTMGRDWLLVWFNEKPLRQDCFNKRAEMYVEVRDWLKNGGAIPNDDELYEEAMAIEAMPMTDGKYKFPPKEAIKQLIGRSPNIWDALCITFAYNVVKKSNYAEGTRGTMTHDFDPYG